MDKTNNGFTLVEMLIVLVITSAITTMLVVGVSTTWSNFSKLNNAKLTIESSKLPLFWFGESINSAILYHPYKNYFSGQSDSMVFHTSKAPDSGTNQVTLIKWRINERALIFESNINKSNEIRLYEFNQLISFQYLTDNRWQSEFNNLPGRLPKAIRIIGSDGSVFVTASPNRPIHASIPEDLRLYGELAL